MDRAEKATVLHREGYNCCQSVVCVFADAVGMDESTLYKFSEGFGAGMGTGKGVCGAIAGAAMLAGLVKSDGNTADPGNTKKFSTRAAGNMQRKFIEQAGRLYCIDIKGHNRWCRFFQSFGVNPLFCYLVGTVLAIAFGAVRFGTNASGDPVTMHSLIHDGCKAITWSPEAASCLYAITFVLITWCFGYILYKKKIYIKI